MQLFSDRGTPSTLRNINGYSGHTYKFTKPDGSFKYVKIHIKTDQGVKTLNAAEATELSGRDPDHNVRDLFEHIERGDYPTWTVFLQVMDSEEAETYRWNIFDMTKVWSHNDYPLRPIGKLTLNLNPTNYFQDVEQAAFSPSTMVPGIASSADPMLQARMFSYPDAARYRLGPNYQQLPPNTPSSRVYSPYQRDGFPSIKGNYGSDPNYVRSSILPVSSRAVEQKDHDQWIGSVTAFTSEVTAEDFVQAAALWNVFGKTEGQQENFVDNVAGHLKDALPEVQRETFKMFSSVNSDLGLRIERATTAAFLAKPR